jgi:hypothetical protein
MDQMLEKLLLANIKGHLRVEKQQTILPSSQNIFHFA